MGRPEAQRRGSGKHRERDAQDRQDVYKRQFVYNVTRVVKIRTGEEDFAALQDVE